MIEIKDILPASEIAGVRRGLDKARFVDGKQTAGVTAAPIKHNKQAHQSDVLDYWNTIVSSCRANKIFEAAVRPKLFQVLFSKYEPGDYYGPHVDNAMMNGGDQRRDVAFTLFLSEPESYEGGELVIERPGMETTIKLEAGCMFVYAATAIHRVNAVTRGTRLAAVGWAQSYVRDADKRELLLDLDAARGALFHRHGKTPETDMLAKTAMNLLRMWSE
jgi:PKHD-type hydroxylase